MIQDPIQDPQTMEIEETIPDVMAEMVRMDKDAMEMARVVREEKAAMARETVRDVMEMARAVRDEKAAKVREMARDVTEMVRVVTVKDVTVQEAREQREKILILWAQE